MKLFSFLILALLAVIQLPAQNAPLNCDDQTNICDGPPLSCNYDFTRSCPTGGTGIIGYFPVITHSGELIWVPLTEQQYLVILQAYGLCS